MAAYQTFIANRATEPDLPALLAVLRALDASVGVQHELGTLTFRVKKDTAWTPAQVTRAQTEIDSAPAVTAQRLAQNEIDNWPLSLKAFALALVDQINVLRVKAGLQEVTPAQALAAIRQKAGEL